LSDEPANLEPTRRDFTRTLVLATGASLTGATALVSIADEDKPKREGARRLAAALIQGARARDGKHLSDEQWAAAEHGLTGLLLAGERVAKVPLINGDEPDTIFRADPP
jgi:hypothetical protein